MLLNLRLASRSLSLLTSLSSVKFELPVVFVCLLSLVRSE